MHHKRRRTKNQRAGCYCGGKDQKHNGFKGRVKVKGLRVPRELKTEIDVEIT